MTNISEARRIAADVLHDAPPRVLPAAKTINSLADEVVRLRTALERIADPRNTHFAGDAQVVAREALAA